MVYYTYRLWFKIMGIYLTGRHLHTLRINKEELQTKLYCNYLPHVNKVSTILNKTKRLVDGCCLQKQLHSAYNLLMIFAN